MPESRPRVDTLWHMDRITVFCSSSTRCERSLDRVAHDVGRRIADAGRAVVFGGGSVGLMGALAEGCKAGGGRLIGITTKRLVELEQASETCDELEIHETMRDRRRRLLELADGVLVLPGGLGTLEEFFEALVGRQLAEHDAPIGIVNAAGALDGLLHMLDDLIAQGFVRDSAKELFFVEDNAAQAVDRLLQTKPFFVNPSRMVPSGTD